MDRSKSVITRIALAAAIFLNYTVGSNAGLDDVLSPDKTVKEIIESFRREMAALIAQAGNESRVTLVRAFQLTDAAINSLSVAYGDNLKLTFNEIDNQQKKVFSDTNELLRQLRNSSEQPLKEANTTVRLATAVIADVGSWSKKPMIVDYFPTYISPATIDGDITITAIGARLQSDEFDSAKLILDNKEFTSSGLTDVSVSFSVPRSTFGIAKGGTLSRSATLILFRESDRLLPGGEPKQIKFQLIFTVLPNELGTISISTTTNLEKEERIGYVSEPDLVATKNGGGEQKFSQCYVPPAGFKFDLSTLRAVETVHTAYKNDDTSSDTNIGYVNMSSDEVLTDTRACITVSALTGCQECGATTAGHLAGQIVRSYQVKETAESPAEPINWLSDLKIKIPDGLADQTFTIKLFGDITKLGTTTSPPEIPFIDFDIDARTNSIFLRPKQVWSIP